MNLSRLFPVVLILTGGFLYAPSVHSDWRNPGENEIWVTGRQVASLQQAFDYATDDSIIRIGPGIYRQGGKLERHNVRIVASKGAVLDGAAVEGKAAIVVAGNDTIIENLACRNIAVKDRNGACIRHEGFNLTLKGVHFTDSEQGILTHDKPGKLIIEDSRFERLGKNGRAHGIYVNGGELEIRRSFILSAKDEGHEIKSRAERTTIEYSVIASLEGNDSRLIDIPSGGVAIIRENLIVEGPKTVNWQLLSFGVEGVRYNTNLLKVEKNLIISDRPGGSEFIGLSDDVRAPIIAGNIVVGNVRYKGWPVNNYFFDKRSDIRLPPAPLLPDWDPVKSSNTDAR